MSNTPAFSPLSPVSVNQVLNYKSCSYSTTAPSGTYRIIPQFVLGAALLILAVIPTVRHSVSMYKLTKRWHTNRSMKLLVKEGTAYFVVYVSLVPVPSITLAASLTSLPKKKLTMLSLEPGIYFSTSSMRSK